MQKLADLNSAVTQAKTERISERGAVPTARIVRDDPAMLDTFPAILTNAFIQQQKTELAQLQSLYAQMGDKLGERHPEMVKIRSAIGVTQAKLETEINKVVEMVKNDYLAALAKEASLAGALECPEGRRAGDESQGDRLQRSRPRGAERPPAVRQPAAAGQGDRHQHRTEDQQYSDRRSRRDAAAAGESRKKPQSACSPCSVVRWRPAALVFFFEYLDSRIKILKRSGFTSDCLPRVVAGPKLKIWSAGYPLVSKRGPGNFAEAFRAVRTNVLFSSSQEGSRSIVVTSTGPGEGKSMVASNLAISMAQAGQRALLIDADMRRPKAHEIFEHHPGTRAVERAGRQRQGE